jgi:hypothetical protein
MSPIERPRAVADALRTLWGGVRVD